MDQLKDFADDRLLVDCTYCGGPEETRDHVPCSVLLDHPLPENLPIVPACRECNHGAGRDEEYFACLVESAACGTTDPELMRRPRIADILRRSPGLRAGLEQARTTEGGKTAFSTDFDRVRKVILKLARGHAAYELSSACRHEPISAQYWPLHLMTDEQRDEFEDLQFLGLIGEIGSRQSQRLLVTHLVLQGEAGQELKVGLLVNDWVEVQENRYRYHAANEGELVRVKMVVGEYLASEVVWERHPSRIVFNSAV